MPISPGVDAHVTYGDEVYVRSDGQRVVAPNIMVDAETMGQYREGYRCMKCQQVQSVPMPEVCEFTGTWEGKTWGCGFRIRDDQLRMLEASDRGEVDVAGLEPEEMFDYEQEQWKKSEGGILVPGTLDEQAVRETIRQNADAP